MGLDSHSNLIIIVATKEDIYSRRSLSQQFFNQNYQSWFMQQYTTNSVFTSLCSFQKNRTQQGSGCLQGLQWKRGKSLKRVDHPRSTVEKLQVWSNQTLLGAQWSQWQQKNQQHYNRTGRKVGDSRPYIFFTIILQRKRVL